MVRTLPLLAALLTGCPPEPNVDDTGDVDTDTDTGAASETAAVFTAISSDYATGVLGTVSLEDWSLDDQLATVTGDSRVVVDDDTVIVISGYGYDSIRLYTPGALSAPDLEFSVAGDSPTNPQDAALCGDKLFVTLYETDWIGAYDPATGVLQGAVDLSAYVDVDGVSPEASSLVELDDKLYVGLQRLDRSGDWWSSVGSEVVEIECSTMSVTRSWSVGGNATVHPWPGTDKVLVGAEAYGDDVGGIYGLDPAANSISLIADLDAVGATFGGIAASGDRAVVIGPAADWSSYGIHCVDLGSGIVATAEQLPDYLGDVAVNAAGEAWIASGWSWLDVSVVPGLIVYDIASCTSLTADDRLDTALGPYSIAFY